MYDVPTDSGIFINKYRTLVILQLLLNMCINSQIIISYSLGKNE